MHQIDENDKIFSILLVFSSPTLILTFVYNILSKSNQLDTRVSQKVEQKPAAFVTQCHKSTISALLSFDSQHPPTKWVSLTKSTTTTTKYIF